MALLDKFKKKTKKEAVRKPKKSEEKKTEERPEPEKPKKTFSKAGVEIYRIIKEPHITEKATALAENGKYIFKVYPRANKTEIQKAIEVLYGVKVEKVNIVRIMPKKRRVGRTEGWKGGLKKGFKKAIVTLKQGEKIEVTPR